MAIRQYTPAHHVLRVSQVGRIKQVPLCSVLLRVATSQAHVRPRSLPVQILIIVLCEKILFFIESSPDPGVV